MRTKPITLFLLSAALVGWLFETGAFSSSKPDSPDRIDEHRSFSCSPPSQPTDIELKLSAPPKVEACGGGK